MFPEKHHRGSSDYPSRFLLAVGSSVYPSRFKLAVSLFYYDQALATDSDKEECPKE